MAKDEKYLQHLYEKYPIVLRFEHLLKEIQDYIIKTGCPEHFVINTDLLGKAVIDYFVDIDRLKSFEDIERVNVAKIYAYQIFWLLRNKPVQINVSADKFHWTINEKICVALVVSKMFAEAGLNYEKRNSQIDAFVSLLFYNFKYRHFTQKSLELMIAAFLCGASQS